MNLIFNKNRAIIILFSIIICLLIIYLALDKIYVEENSVKKSGLKIEEINDRFLNILSGFAIKDDWIKKRDSSDYIIQVPADLPVTVILADIYNSFDEDEAEISVEEKTIRGRTILEIVSNDSELKAEFRYNDKILRKSSDIGLLIEDFTNINPEGLNEILKIVEPFGVILVPSEAAKKLADTLRIYRKEYAVELNDEISDIDYKLSSSYSRYRLELSLREIISTFSDALFFIVDNSSDFYSSEVYNFVKHELEKRNIKIILKNSLEMISGGGEFVKKVSETEDKESRLFLTEADDFLALQDEIVSFRKTGYRFINPSDIVFEKVD